MGEGIEGRGGGSRNVCCIPKNNLPQLSHVSRQEGIKSGLFSRSLSLCSPLMPPNQPGGDIIILEPGVTVGRTPGAGSLVCDCVYMYMCLRACVCAWQPGSLWPHHQRVWVSHSLFKHAPWAASPNTLCLANTHTHTHAHWVQVSCREGENTRADISVWILSATPYVWICPS